MRSILNWFRRSRVGRWDPFPDEWASFLWDYSAHYRRVPRRLQTAFERDVQRFIAKQRITGVETAIDDPLRLLVAMSAATLSVGWPGYKWSEVSEVLLYPDDFDRDYAIGRRTPSRELAGMAHVWGTVILSVPSLRHSFACYDGCLSCGAARVRAPADIRQGTPERGSGGPRAARIELWEAIQAHELTRIAGGESIVDRYALQPGEFFPCAVEAFFQKPIELRDGHQRLYRFLSRYFRQNPACGSHACAPVLLFEGRFTPPTDGSSQRSGDVDLFEIVGEERPFLR